MRPSAPGNRAAAARNVVDLPSPGWPTGFGPGAADPLPTPGWPIVHHADADHSAPHAATVHRGDSLWVIAARRLGRQATPEDVAAAWPRWYAANRAVIGDDPGLITPGQVLHVPAAVTEESRR